MGKLTARITYEDISYRSPHTEIDFMGYSSYPGFTVNYKIVKNETKFVDAKFDDIAYRWYVTDEIKRVYSGKLEFKKRALFEEGDEHRNLKSKLSFLVSSSIVRTKNKTY